MRVYVVLALAMLSGCYAYSRDWNGGDEVYGYCDVTGCYDCDSYGCWPAGDTPPTGGCSCGLGFSCDSTGTCQPRACTADAQCEDGCYCDGSVCIETKRCLRDRDCAALNMVCDEERTTCEPDTTEEPPPPPPPPPPACETDADCAEGASCHNAVCVPPLPWNPALNCSNDGQCGGGVCEEGLCHPRCTEPSQCGTGDTCDNGRCTRNTNPDPVCVFNQDCGGNLICINGTCHGTCSVDDDCSNPKDFCESDICQPDWRVVSECALDRDCTGAGEQCVNAQCRNRCMQDAQCAESPDGPFCVAGYCQG